MILFLVAISILHSKENRNISNNLKSKITNLELDLFSISMGGST